VSLKAALVCVGLLQFGCSVFAPKGPSEVAKGEYYSAGRPEFDSFFIELHGLQVALVTAPNEPAEARRSLTHALGLPPAASDEALRQQLSDKLRELASQGLRVRLEVPEPTPALDASAVLHTSESSTPSPLRDLLPEQATRLVRSRNSLLSTKAQLEKMLASAIGLQAQVDAAFRTAGVWKRDEVRKNLEDAQKVMALMQARASEVLEQDEKLLGLLQAAASTDPTLGKSAAETPTVEPRRPPRRTGPARAGVPAPVPRPGAGAAPAPAKPSPARGSEDDAPAPKPVQGSAPAEIEP